MQIQYEKNDRLPALAWYADVSGDTVRVLHGDAIECRNNFFVEGAWSGSFSEGNFTDSDWFCGTGAQVFKDKIIFSTPSHVTYGVYSFEKRGGYCLSNSLYLLMSMQKLHYDVNYVNYEIDFNSIIDGINQYSKDLYVLNQNEKEERVRIEYFKNITITNCGEYISTNKKKVYDFTSFDDYYSRLLKDMGHLVENAADKSREHQYGIVTTISKGYDAPCCAAIAHKLGCDTALTFSAEGKYKEDCGSDVARAIGYKNIIEVDANTYANRNDLIEVEYVCSGELGAQISFSSFDHYACGNILLTGERGDSVWGKHAVNRNNEFSFEDMLSHLGSCEHRLWANYISVPMPLYGATSWTSLYDIANSDEMKPWSVSNSYDRPIPRRIIETAGVNRNQFGIEKHGAGFVYKFDWLERIQSRMSPAAAEDFGLYVKQNRKLRYIATVVYLWKFRSLYLRKIGLKLKGITPYEIGKIANPMAPSYLIPWAGQHMIKRYEKIIEGL